MSSIKLIYEDGQGKIVNEDGSEALSQMIDENSHGLQTISTHSRCLESKNTDILPEVSENGQTDDRAGSPIMPPAKKGKTTRQRNTYSDEDIIRFFKLKDEKLLSANAAAKKLNINPRVAQRWVKKYDEDPDNIFVRGKKSGKRRLTDEHKKCIKEFVAKNASVYVKDVMDHLITIFGEINVSRETVRRFMIDECNLTFKKGVQTSKHLTSTCDKEEAKGVIYVSLRDPKFSKKQPSSGESGKKATAIDHFFMFVKSILGEMDKYPAMEGSFLVMDNAPIHQSAGMSQYIVSREYRSIYLPAYPTELNPIEMFRKVVKDSVR
ncbi:Homeodomain-like DNA binding domain-containing transcription factor [Phycomyces blakesleeanus NRRL 1555(-)]|uniref:Homeodomain-like DNA binding domain-containing transcription factor n=1 Tax=Phycomyces blakesleeanus (strain ATCC 8743b / DSM 1359 / FGSC 10004 / NBRC 33097 / NRRL 1555) TaxID=763407 RepID=A0A162T6T9_PHYB8|nr:Homeodomain-like DNA binding domain-containing transcription factor [Phycomyces blakesleeanus NRRL 1555(-)]OAD66622.1 Homeodomain-like DNA binding domain-containing transcription factor [Phycomyces blakesleeanus NRRL 1555(-)]|eukprot:XP_018284662.1 Homeodomain-like DNA binding domain-containing transcription factor [Phycomyces blakesleeanus NRRL 1555(-)]